MTYEVERACPPQEAFVDSIRRYTRKRASEHRTRDLRVRIEGRAPNVVGKLSITNEYGKTTKRELTGPDCEAVIRGLAIVVALTIDPKANVLQTSSPELARNDDEHSSNEGPSAEPPQPKASSDLSEPSAAKLAVTPESRRSAILPSSPREEMRVRVVGELRAELTSAVVPGWLPMVGVAIGLDVHPRHVPAWVRPSFAIGGRRSTTKEVEVSGGAAGFVLTAATARACPVNASLFARRLELVPCIEGELGALEADGRGLRDAQRTSTLWLNVGASAYGLLRLLDHWFVTANVLISRPLSRYRFELDSGDLISKAPSAGVTVGVGVSVGF